MYTPVIIALNLCYCCKHVSVGALLIIKHLSYPILSCPLRPTGGGTPHMKGVGMLVVSFRGVNFGFWSHLGCSGQNAIIFSHEDIV